MGLAQGGPREPQGPILVDFLSILKVVLGPQMAILGLYWDVMGLNGSKQQ